MQLTSVLYRNSVLFFTVFVLAVLWAFWGTYYSNPFQVSNGLIHLHGIAMSLWCAMLLGQAYLIRSGQRALHRQIGRASFVLAPLNFALQIAVVHGHMLRFPRYVEAGAVTDAAYVFLSLSLIGAVLFAIFYGLAILNRRIPAIHGGFMVCTTLPILAAVTDRIIAFYFPEFGSRLPVVAGAPYFPFVAWAIEDSVVISLSIWDWTSHRRLKVFPVALLLLVSYQVFTLNAYRVPLWRALCDWYIGPMG